GCAIGRDDGDRGKDEREHQGRSRGGEGGEKAAARGGARARRGGRSQRDGAAALVDPMIRRRATPGMNDKTIQSPAAAPRALTPQALCRPCDPARFDFNTTDDLADFTDALGQGRAIDAIRFGVGVRRDGFNIFAMGPEGLGRHSLVRKLLAQRAPGQDVPPDWCYVFNFETPHKPRVLKLPSGRAPKFRQDMAHLVEDLRAGIPAAFETDEYRTRLQEIETEFNERQAKAIGEIGDR